MFATPKLGNFPKLVRLDDENLSDDSVEDLGHKDHIDEISQIAV